MSVPATYRSGTPRAQHPAVARWHAHLRGLATAIHEISGLALIPGIIRDVIRIIGGGGSFTAELVNDMLEQLGWKQEVLDETTFQLIVYILETEWGYRVRHYSIS